MKPRFKKRLRENVNGLISFDTRLRDHTTFKVGGRPSAWVEPASLEDLERALKIFSEAELRPFLIGGGSNILVRDGRLNIAVVRLSKPCFKRLKFNSRFVICGSGHSLSGLVKKCIKNGLGGLERFAGIPGTVGGAIAANAGAGKKLAIGDFIEWVKVMDYSGNRISLFNKERLKFSYRYSNLSRYIILEAKFSLRKSNSETISRICKESLKRKMAVQDYGIPNVGCIFRNPRDFSLTSGQILERCGLKGARRGGAEVSAKHANFIVNRKKARFADIMSLIKLGQTVAKKNFGIWLEPEIKIVK